MLRASSEMAVETSVASLVEKPSFSARTRPSRRAATRSSSEETVTRLVVSRSEDTLAMSRFPVEVRQTFFEIQRGGNILEGYTKLHHGEGDLGLDPDDHRFRAT